MSRRFSYLMLGTAAALPTATWAAGCDDEEVGAFVAAQMAVEQQLKAPSTAEFPPAMNRDGVRIVNVGGCVYMVIAYVDSENGFGAMIRTQYAAKLQLDSSAGTWTVLQLETQ